MPDRSTPMFIFLLHLLCPATKSGGVLCYTLRTFECLSVCLSVRPSVRPSAVDHSCPLHNSDIVRDNFKYITIYNMIRRRAEINNRHSTYIFGGIIPLCNFQYRNRVRSITLIPLEIISQNLAQI